MSQPFVVQLPDKPDQVNRMFVASDSPVTGGLPPMAECCKYANQLGQCDCKDGKHESDDKSVMRYLNYLWTRARDARQSEHARIRMIEKLYRGIHYEDLGNYKKLEVTNFCYANVETVAGLFNRARSMPRLEPTKPVGAEQAKKIRETAHWWQTRQRAWMTRALSNRVKTKFGYTILLLTIDPASGMPFVSNWNPVDWYPDPSAKDVPGCEFFVFGAPIPTRRLKAMFPKMADQIKPDSYVSPQWEVNKRIDQQLFYDQWIRNYSLPSITNESSTAPFVSTPQPTGSSQLMPERVAYSRRGSETTFFFQFIVRDRTPQDWMAPGNVQFQTPSDPEPMSYPDTYQYQLPACPSGWRVFYATPETLLAQSPVDECYGGLPFVVDYYVRHEGRIEGIGEIEPIAPLQRAYNERKNMLNRALRISAAPVLRADKGSGINFSRRTIEAGDVLEPNKGSSIEWLEYQGPNAQQFNHLATEKRDMEVVSGVHEALQGIRPEGVETGVAIRELASASATRIQAKMPEAGIAWAEVILKAIKIMRAKLTVPLMFKATDGTMLSVTKEDLDFEGSFYFPTEENDVDADQKREEKLLTYYQLGLVDRIAVLEQSGLPDWQQIAMRMMQMDMMKAKLDAEAKAKSLGNAKDAKEDKGESSGPAEAA